MRNHIVFVLIACGISLSGCANIGRMTRIDPVAVGILEARDDNCSLTPGLSKGDRAAAINLDCYKVPVGIGADGSVIRANAYATALSEPLVRDRLQDRLIDQSNAVCTIDIGRIQGGESATGLITDFAAASTSITSTIVGGEQAKSILSGISGLTTGTRASILDNAYKGQVVPAIIQVILNERKSAQSDLDALKGKTIDEVSVDEMIRRVNEYHQLCSFSTGLSILIDAAVNKKGYEQVVTNYNRMLKLERVQREYRQANALGLLENPDIKKRLEDQLAELLVVDQTDVEQGDGIETIPDPD